MHTYRLHAWFNERDPPNPWWGVQVKPEGSSRFVHTVEPHPVSGELYALIYPTKDEAKGKLKELEEAQAAAA